jgi:hypothetical protein
MKTKEHFDNLFREFSERKNSLIWNHVKISQSEARHESGVVDYYIHFEDTISDVYVKVYEDMTLEGFIEAARFQTHYFVCDYKYAVVFEPHQGDAHSKRKIFWDGESFDIRENAKFFQEEGDAVREMRKINSDANLGVVVIPFYPSDKL